MEDLTKWLLTEGNTISVSGLLLTFVVMLTVGLYKMWWVPGYVHKDCLEGRKTDQEQLKMIMEENKRKSEEALKKSEEKLEEALRKIEAMESKRR